jgi:hypothetical protein
MGNSVRAGKIKKETILRMELKEKMAELKKWKNEQSG